MDIVTMGEALIDFKSEGRLAFQGYVGGSPLNVAVAASRMGMDSGFAGQISDDEFGRAIRDHMRANGVDRRLVSASDAPTTLAFVTERDGDAHFQFFGEGAADRTWDPGPRPSLPDDVRMAMFGSIALLAEPTRGTILEIIDAHRGRVVPLLDPNVRPLLQRDRKRYAADVDAWARHAAIVKVSEQDLGWLHPGLGARDAAERWLAHGVAAVIVTGGATAVELYRADRPVVSVAPPTVDVADTVGAGDTFTGALMATLVRRGVKGEDSLAALDDDAWREALRVGAAAAALNCTRAGADPPTRDEVERFIEART